MSGGQVYNDLKWDVYKDALHIQMPNKLTIILKQASKQEHYDVINYLECKCQSV